LDGPPVLVAPDPVPAGLPRCAAVARYDGAVRRAVVAYKDRGRLALGVPLGRALGRAAVAAAGRADLPSGVGAARCRPVLADTLVLVVAVPSSRAAVRARGRDHLGPLVRGAVRALHDAGVPATAAPLLRSVTRRADLAGLSAHARAQAVLGAFAVQPSVAARWRRGGKPLRLLLVDDVLTTGSTLAEAAATLRAADLDVHAAAVIAATVRRCPAGQRASAPQARG